MALWDNKQFFQKGQERPILMPVRRVGDSLWKEALKEHEVKKARIAKEQKDEEMRKMLESEV